ncbi:flippase [Methanocella conradii]|nr:flippase [Methanocella conradii]
MNFGLTMSKSLDSSLRQIAKGTTIIFSGVIASMALNFILRVALVRYTTQGDYGVYSLALTIISMLCIVSTLGLDEGASRYIAYFLGKSDSSGVKRVIFSALALALAASLICAAALFIFSDAIALFFHSRELSNALKIISLAIPSTVLIQILVSITRGFNVSIMKVLFNDVMKPLSFLALLLIVILLGMSFDAIITAYVASTSLTMLAFAAFTLKWYSGHYSAAPDAGGQVTMGLIRFSIPLLSVNMLLMMMSQATTLLLGFFKTPIEVGKFDIAIMMGNLLLTVINSMGYIYMPTASSLYGKNQVEDLKRSYIISTKWGYIGTLPMLFAFLVFPGVVVDLLFGPRYSDVAVLLQVLCLGYLINPLTGPNYHTLISMGKTRIIIESFLANALINLVLSILLIPPMGVIGAAIAVSISVMVANALLTVRLYQLLGVHPFTRNYVASILSSLLLLSLFFFGARWLAIVPAPATAIVCFIAYMAAYAALFIGLRAIDKEDAMILSAVKLRLQSIPVIGQVL